VCIEAAPNEVGKERVLPISIEKGAHASQGIPQKKRHIAGGKQEVMARRTTIR